MAPCARPPPLAAAAAPPAQAQQGQVRHPLPLACGTLLLLLLPLARRLQSMGTFWRATLLLPSLALPWGALTP